VCLRHLIGPLLFLFPLAVPAAPPPNIVLITMDDLYLEGVGVYGGAIADLTPELDQLAADGLRFDQAHVVSTVCIPSRNSLMTGLAPLRHGGLGFHDIRPDVATLPGLLKEQGYRTGVIGKAEHMIPVEQFEWDTIVYSYGKRGGLGTHARDVEAHYRHAAEFIDAARAADAPFFLNVNIADPHYPLDTDGIRRIVEPGEAPLIPYHADTETTRRQWANYHSLIGRGDRTVGRVLDVLDERGLADHAIVVFLSDHGFPFPFGKASLYPMSTHTPLIIRWPGVIEAGRTESERLVSSMDLMPTLLDIAGAAVPEGLDGLSLAPLLRGASQPTHDYLVTEYHYTPSRCILDGRYAYVINFWAGTGHFLAGPDRIGKLAFNNRWWEQMKAAGAEDPRLADAAHRTGYGVPEELFDLENDPHCLNNRIDDPAFAGVRRRLRDALIAHMEAKDDPALEATRNPTPENLAVYCAFHAKAMDAADARGAY